MHKVVGLDVVVDAQCADHGEVQAEDRVHQQEQHKPLVVLFSNALSNPALLPPYQMQ